MKILGIESSCDETSVAIVEDGKKLLTHVVASSAEMHRKYGGIVPEVAARKQVEYMIPVLTEAMEGFTKDDIDMIAVTIGPGLIGSLLVGVETAKTLAMAWGKPIIPVNHVRAHPYAAFITEDYSSSEGAARLNREASLNNKSSRLATARSNNNLGFPAIALVVSGGHTELFFMKDASSIEWLGGTLDDAAGECFDKCARLLGFENRGGPAIAAAADNFQPSKSISYTRLPRPLMDDPFNFSFSGLKTAVLREWKKLANHTESHINALAFELQEAITDVLVKKTLHAANIKNVRSIIVSGGVAANQRLREKCMQKITERKLPFSLHIPTPRYCVDSASYIATSAFYHNQPAHWKTISATPNLSVE